MCRSTARKRTGGKIRSSEGWSPASGNSVRAAASRRWRAPARSFLHRGRPSPGLRARSTLFSRGRSSLPGGVISLYPVFRLTAASSSARRCSGHARRGTVILGGGYAAMTIAALMASQDKKFTIIHRGRTGIIVPGRGRVKACDEAISG